jgi:hypothetical protein
MASLISDLQPVRASPPSDDQAGGFAFITRCAGHAARPLAQASRRRIGIDVQCKAGAKATAELAAHDGVAWTPPAAPLSARPAAHQPAALTLAACAWVAVMWPAAAVRGDVWAPYDLLGAFLGVRLDRLRGVVARWRRAGYAATGRLGPGPGVVLADPLRAGGHRAALRTGQACAGPSGAHPRCLGGLPFAAGQPDFPGWAGVVAQRAAHPRRRICCRPDDIAGAFAVVAASTRGGPRGPVTSKAARSVAVRPPCVR